MLVSDLLHSCANDRVAEAAVSSIGGAFASRVQAGAADDGVTVGSFTSRIVREFAVLASERDWRDLVMAVRGQDHPVLAGLQVIVSRRLGAMRSTGEGLTGRHQPKIVLSSVAA